MIQHKLYQEDLEYISCLDVPWSLLNRMSILITGANGLIGSVLVDTLIYRNEVMKENIDIWILVRNETVLKNRYGRYLNRRYFHYIIQDVCTKINIHTKIDYIIHGASKGDPSSFANDPIGIMNANYLGMLQVLELAREKGSKKVVYISSGEVYGIIEKVETTGIDEQNYGYLDILKPRSCYASSKKAAETLCASYHEQFGVNVSIARPCHTYGATMLSTDSRVIGEFLRSAIKNDQIVMKSQGLQKRSYCYVADTAAAIFYILLCGSGKEAYNIANRDSVLSIKELAESIAEIQDIGIRYEIPDKFEQKGYSDIQHAVLNATKLEMIGWKPNFNIREGISRSLRILMDNMGGLYG